MPTGTMGSHGTISQVSRLQVHTHPMDQQQEPPGSDPLARLSADQEPSFGCRSQALKLELPDDVKQRGRNRQKQQQQTKQPETPQLGALGKSNEKKRACLEEG